jgi:predicted ester cyclase
MSAEQVRETMQSSMEALLARGDYRCFFADNLRLEVVGTDQRVQGAESAEQAIRFLHEVAFDASPEITNVLVDDHGAAAEANFVGTHVCEFAGIAATGSSVRVPYSVFYELDDGAITALRIYMAMDQLVAQIDAANANAASRLSDHRQRPTPLHTALRRHRRASQPRVRGCGEAASRRRSHPS